MASVEKRLLANGDTRFAVHWRVYGKSRERAFRLRRDAEAWKRKVEADELAGVSVDPRAGDERLGAYAEQWLKTRLVKGRPLSPMTAQGYAGLLRRNILPALGEAPLRRITVETVRNWYAQVVAEAGQDAAAKSYRLLRAILNTAVDDERLGRNPCRIKGAGAERTEERPMVDAATVLDLAEAMGPRLRTIVLLAGFGGLRTGEMLGLRRCDIDVLRGSVSVREEAQQISGRGRVVSGPKSEAGRRTVALPKTVMRSLEDHLAQFAEPTPEGVVFTAPRGGPLRRAELSQKWRAAVASVGAREGLHIHDLRHHAATSMARIPGVTTKELMARIGHASPRAALIYQHATEERDRAVADVLEAQIASVNRPRMAPIRAIKTTKVPDAETLVWGPCGAGADSSDLPTTKNAR